MSRRLYTPSPWGASGGIYAARAAAFIEVAEQYRGEYRAWRDRAEIELGPDASLEAYKAKYEAYAQEKRSQGGGQ
jgi:hypothetical protein